MNPKSLVLVVLLVLGICTPELFAQYRIDSLKVFNEQGDVKVLAYLWSAHTGFYPDKIVVTRTGNNVNIDGTYVSGLGTAIQLRQDTVSLGTFEAGEYCATFICTQKYFPANADTATICFTVDSLGVANSIIKNFALDLEVFPNPTTGYLRINSFQAKNLSQVKFYDANGREHQAQIIHSDEQSIIFDVSNFPNGLYVLELTDNGRKILYTKFHKE